MPMKLVINIMLADVGITPVHIQHIYLQKLGYARIISKKLSCVWCADVASGCSVWVTLRP